jgi:hypothetical protein
MANSKGPLPSTRRRRGKGAQLEVEDTNPPPNHFSGGVRALVIIDPPPAAPVQLRQDRGAGQPREFHSFGKGVTDDEATEL